MATSCAQVSAPSKDAPRSITPTVEELKASSYDTTNIEAALEALSQDGFVVLKSVVDKAHVEHLNSFMTKEADELLKNNVKPFNQGVNCKHKHLLWSWC
jgi:vacuolar-type H+-ATPase subunit C/Vma6